MPYNTVIVFIAYNPLPAADLNSNFANLDYLNNKINSQFILPGAAMKPATFAPAAQGEVQMTTNHNNYMFMDFADNGGFTVADIAFPMPSDYNGGTVTAKFYWIANSTSTNSVVWGVGAVSFADDDNLDGAYGTVQYVTDANKNTANDLNISDATAAITIAGTPAAGELVNWRIVRNASDAADNLAATARLLAVVITYTRS